MSRHKSDCDTYNREYGPEPEEEDFFKEVVQNSLKTKKKGYLREKGKQ
ncbi:hypothetical protein GOV07_03535 [Candidatus Woesearchaeota archaeon]|nr:hypothetical protein [Candidatus Woesearchaeota archaeon]